MHHNGSASLLLLSLVLLSVVIGLSSAALGAPTGSDTLAQQATETDNNTTVQHERPSQVSEEGDTQQVGQWLEQRLQSQLRGSAVNISQGQYESARNVVGDSYDSRLDQYVDVAGETESDGDDQAAETFNETRSEQDEFANTSQTYDETYEEYQDAQEQGNTTRARETARELETLSERLVSLNESLQGNYDRLQNRTGISTATTSTAIAETTRDISTTQAAVRTETFVETNLTVETNGTSVAFDNPLAVSGRIQASNNTTLRNESVTVLVANRRYPTRTDDAGRFDVTYRPVALAVNASTVSVRYRPGRTTQYLGDGRTIDVNVSQVTPTLEVAASSDSVGYGDTVTTRVNATVDGRPVPLLPLVQTIGSATTRNATASGGTTTLSGTLPASVTAGNRTLSVNHTRSGRAIAPAVTTTPVTVTTTATNLTINASARNESVAVRGQLRTVSGQPVDGQPLAVTVAGRNRSVTTNATGWYRVPATNLSAVNSTTVSNVSVQAQFSGTESNLEASRAETTVALPGSPATPESTVPLEWILVGALGVVLILGAIALSRYTGTGAEQTVPADPEPQAPAEPTPTPVEGLLADARAALEAGRYDSAIGAAYASARTRLTADHGLSNELTHREFLTAVEAHVGQLPKFETLAGAYERATFEGAGDAATAEKALAAATDLLDTDD